MVHWQLDLEVKILSTRCKWSNVHHMPLPALVAFPGILNIFPAKYFTKICQIFAKYLQHICLRSKLLQHLFGESQKFCGQFRSMSRPKRTTQCKKFLSGPSTCSLYYSIFVFKIVFTFLCEWGWVVKKVV